MDGFIQTKHSMITLQNPVLKCNNQSDTLFVRYLNIFFRHLGVWLSEKPILFLIGTIVLTLAMASSIPLTPMTNDISDFTPYAARARAELQAYEDFFNSEGEPIVAVIMVSGKNDASMLSIKHLNETVRLLDHFMNDIYFYNSATKVSMNYQGICTSFCTINEPVRQFYNGLLVNRNYNDSTSSIDLGYPSTTVLGRRFRVDTNFFGIRVEVIQRNGKREMISLDQAQVVNGFSILDDEEAQVVNNIKDIRLVILQLRAQKPHGATKDDVEKYERQIVNYPKINFTSPYIDVVILTSSYLKSEIVRNGLRLAPFTLSGFFIMCIFSSVTATISAVYMGQMNIDKIILAIAACICPFMACSTALGGLFWLGVRFGSILCVTPFLVLAIGVDDAFLMIHSWQRNNQKVTKLRAMTDPKDMPSEVTEVSKRIGNMLEDIGPSITITTMTNVLAFGIGALTPTPEIRLFCIANAVAMMIDLIYQVAFFASIMALVTRRSIRREKEAITEKKFSCTRTKHHCSIIGERLKSYMEKYCSFICNSYASMAVLSLLMLYWCISVYGALTMKAELKPEQLLSEDSDLIKVIQHRDNYIMSHYLVCYVFVNNPGNISDPKNLQRLNQLVKDFETLPSSVGRFSTKYWLRDYEEFIESSDAISISEYDDETWPSQNGSSIEKGIAGSNELLKFLAWPEFHYWEGFIHYRINEREQIVIEKFFFTTASHGSQLNQWSQRAALMTKWRSIADQYADLGASVYEDDARFLDIIGTMATQTIQSSICTLICMMLVCLLFIKRFAALLTATLSIISTCIGVFGILSLWGVELDPIVMSALIMSIGFSVDIPAHVTYHFYRIKGNSVKDRLQHCLSDITYPILQAALSTLICLLSLLFVPIHMSVVFVKTMVLVVIIGLIHGLLIIPVFFNTVSLLTVSRTFAEPNQKQFNEHVNVVLNVVNVVVPKTTDHQNSR